MENENRKTLKQKIISIQRDYKRYVEKNGGAGAIGINVFEVAQWEIKCKNYFNRYYKTTKMIVVPSERDRVMDTLSIVCSESEGRGFVFKNYDIVKHFEFLGYSKVSLEAKLGIPLIKKVIPYVAYIEHKNVLFVCEKVVKGFTISQCLKNTAAMVKYFLTLYNRKIEGSGVTVIGLLLREKGNQEELVGCSFCHLFSPSYEVFESPTTYKEWWSSVENYENWWNLANPKNRNKLFEDLAAGILCFMAAENKSIPSVTKDKSQQFKQAYFLYTPQQMNILLSSAKHVVIQGSYGSGKSLLGLKKLELISKGLTQSEKILYLNFDSKSNLHLAMEKNLKEYVRIPPSRIKLINSVREISESPNKLVYVCHNSAGNNLSDILQDTIKLNITMSEKNKANFHFIVEEFDGEMLVQYETSKLRKVVNGGNFSQSNIMILAQPLMKKRSLIKDKKCYERKTCMFSELAKEFKILKLDEVLRCSNEICEILKSTQSYVRSKESVFSTEMNKVGSRQQREPRANKSYMISRSLQESVYPDWVKSKKEPSEIGLATKFETSNNESISYCDIDFKKTDQKYNHAMDLDLAFEKVASFQNNNTAKNKIISNFEFLCEPRKGVDINGLKPTLVEFSDKINSKSNMAVLSLALVLKRIISKNKATVLLHIADEEPGILRKAIQLFPRLLDEKFLYTKNIREFLQKNRACKIIFSGSIHSVNGMEFDHVVIVVRQSEYYLKHYIPLPISRCTYDLTLILLAKGKNVDENDFPGKSKEDENKETVVDMIDDLKRKCLVKEMVVAECQTCGVQNYCYCISDETHNKSVFGVHTHSDGYKESLFHLENYEELENDLQGTNAGVVAEAK